MDIEEMLDRVIELHKQIEGYKKAYSELDTITMKLLELNFKTTVFRGHPIMLVDNFKDKNCVFRTTGVRRFEIKIGE
jgi:hypothetical protein